MVPGLQLWDTGAGVVVFDRVPNAAFTPVRARQRHMRECRENLLYAGMKS